MAATVVTKILRGFLKNLPKGEAKELAGRYGFLKSEPKAAREISDAEVKARKEIAERIRKTGVRREPKKEKQFELLVEEPKEEIITTIDTKAWEKAGFPGLREHATERLATSQQRQKRLQSALEERLDIVDVEKETAKEKVARVKEIQRLREVGVAQERLNRFAGREFWKGEKEELLPITDEQMIESGYERMGTRIPSDEPRDPFGRLLSEFPEWGKEHMQMKAMLRDKEQTLLKEGKIERILSEAEIDQAVTNEVNKGRPLYESYSQYIPYKDAPSGQYIMTKVDVPPTAQDVRRLSRGEEVPSEIIVVPESEKVIGEEIATSYGMPVEEIPSFQPVLSVNPAQEKVLFRQEIPGLPRRLDENRLAKVLEAQAKREQFLGTLDTFGRRAEPTTAMRRQQELSLEVPSIADPKIIARLRKEAADLRYKRTRFRQKISEEVQKNPYRENAHEKAWEKIKNTKAYKKYVRDRIKLQREINTKAPDLMEADPFEVTRETIRPKRQPSLRLGIEGEPSEQYLDRVTSEVGKIKQPTKRLADSFKKGSKVVSRKRGGMIKKPRGWGAARYNIN
mgnify:FL=1